MNVRVRRIHTEMLLLTELLGVHFMVNRVSALFLTDKVKRKELH